MTTEGGERKKIRSAEKAFDIVGSLQEMGGAGVTELAEHLDIPKSTVYSYLSTLEETEYVVKRDDQYDVGLRFLNHGTYAKGRLEINSNARPSIEKLADETGEAIWVVVEEHGYAVSVDVTIGESGLRTFTRTGRPQYIHTLATGKAILAEYSEAEVDDIIDRHGLPGSTEATITDRDELFAELERIRERGYAFNESEAVVGNVGIGVSVVTEGEVHGAIGLSAPENRMQQEEYRNDLPKMLMGTANEIELKIQYGD